MQRIALVVLVFSLMLGSGGLPAITTPAQHPDISDQHPAFVKLFAHNGDVARIKASGAVLRYRGTWFVLTAAHFAKQTIENNHPLSIVFHGKRFPYQPPQGKHAALSHDADIAAFPWSPPPVTTRDPLSFPPTFSLTEDASTLAVICSALSPIRRVGTYRGLTQPAPWQKNVYPLSITFKERGVDLGCSGSAVIDTEGFVYGIVVSRDKQRLQAGAVSAWDIMMFLDKAYFTPN